MQEIVYHGSSAQNLELINPRASTHGKPYVYATRHSNLAVLFIANIFGDLAYYLSYHYSKTHSLPVIEERFKGAFELAQGSETTPRTGAIYKVSSKTFEENKTGWSEDLVSTEPVKPLDEIKIENVYRYILELESQRALCIICSKKPFENSKLYYKCTNAETSSKEKERYMTDIKKYNPSILKIFNKE